MMKNLVLFLSVLLSLNGYAQNEPEALGLPGDNLNLFAVLDVFQKSKTLEEFEKSLNDESKKLNNLDLNNDSKVDYIRVVSEKEGTATLVILQVFVSEKEKQDVAVITVSKDAKDQIAVQVIGNETLYGKDYIVEPNASQVAGTPNPGYTGGGTTIINNTTNNYNTTNNTTTNNNDNNNGNFASVGAWPIVTFMFSPMFVPYNSPFYWGYYPPYWNPWSPMYFNNYWGYHGHFYGNGFYRRSPVIVNNHYYNGYYPRRNNSVIVVNTTRNNGYRNTYNGVNYRRPDAPSQSTRPTTTTGTRPSTRPTSTNVSGTRPSTRPTSTNVSGTRPATRPTSTNISGTRPATRPTSVNTSGTRPSSRPTSTTMSGTRSATRPTSVNTPSSRQTPRSASGSSRSSGASSKSTSGQSAGSTRAGGR